MLGAKNTGKSTVIRQMKKIAEAEYESDKDKEKSICGSVWFESKNTILRIVFSFVPS